MVAKIELAKIELVKIELMKIELVKIETRVAVSVAERGEGREREA